jgi:hypothetical protein
MTYDPVPRFRHHETPVSNPRADVDYDVDAFVDPDDDEDCRAGLLEIDRPDDDDA